MPDASTNGNDDLADSHEQPTSDETPERPRQSLSFDDFRRAMAVAEGAYGRPMTADELTIWYGLLGDLSAAELTAAVVRVCRNLTTWPTVADILAAARAHAAEQGYRFGGDDEPDSRTTEFWRLAFVAALREVIRGQLKRHPTLGDLMAAPEVVAGAAAVVADAAYYAAYGRR